MPMKLIMARERPTDYLIRVHLDPTKTVNGQPDPAYIEEFTWGKEPPEGLTKQAYLAMIRRETKLLCEARLAQRTARPSEGTRLAIEGEDL